MIVCKNCSVQKSRARCHGCCSVEIFVLGISRTCFNAWRVCFAVRTNALVSFKHVHCHSGVVHEACLLFSIGPFWPY